MNIEKLYAKGMWPTFFLWGPVPRDFWAPVCPQNYWSCVAYETLIIAVLGWNLSLQIWPRDVIIRRSMCTSMWVSLGAMTASKEAIYGDRRRVEDSGPIGGSTEYIYSVAAEPELESWIAAESSVRWASASSSERTRGRVYRYRPCQLARRCSWASLHSEGKPYNFFPK